MTHTILQGDVREQLKSIPDDTARCCVTSPPYFGLRDYGMSEQIGLERNPDAFIEELVDVFREVRRVLTKDGTLWVNIGDSYAGSGKGPEGNIGKGETHRNVGAAHGGIVPDGMKPKDLIGIPWMLAFALRKDGWYLRQDIIWHKTTSMPESVKDRCTRNHEYLFLLSKSRTYYFDAEAIKTPAKQESEKYAMANKRSVWTMAPSNYKGAHFATFPTMLVEPCILAGSAVGDTVLDPFLGSGTTLAVAKQLNRNAIGIELNPEYIKLAEQRINTIENPLY
jgi:site-specific DNA-methyltransferase (cytosine-N4-specific)